MRLDIDYRRYDPANFIRDHPDDLISAEARQRAKELAGQLREANLQGTSEEQRRQIEQRFDQLQNQEWDDLERQNVIELRDELKDYTNEKTDALYRQAFERIDETRTREGKTAAWEGVQRHVQEARENAPDDPEFKERQEQLTQYQAARSEATSQAIYEIQQDLIQERGLKPDPDKESEPKLVREPKIEAEPERPYNPANENHITEDLMAKAQERRESGGPTDEERLARVRQDFERTANLAAEQEKSKSNELEL